MPSSLTKPSELSSAPAGAMRLLVATLRLAVAALILAAVLATVAEAAGRTTINPFNMFGYFTIQSNLIVMVVLFVGGVLQVRRRADPSWLLQARASAVTYIAVVGLVYATLLAPLGAAGGVPVPWANTVLHVVTPIFGVLDWLLAPDRRRLPFRRTIALTLVYPLVWSAVVLIRGATDGWVPYPFLDPSTGYGTVAVYVVLIAVTIALTGALVVAATRLSTPGPRPMARVP